MHYGNLIIIERPDDADEPLDLEAAVAQAMGPHEDQGGFWDWYQIGGRWTGHLDGYDPDADPKNQEPCRFCKATGTTTAAVAAQYPAYEEHVDKPCIQCKGTGTRTTWPTSWAQHPGDVQPIENLTEEAYGHFYRVISPSGRRWGGEEYRPWEEKIENRFRDLDKPPLEWLKTEYPQHLIVVVDNHS